MAELCTVHVQFTLVCGQNQHFPLNNYHLYCGNNWIIIDVDCRHWIMACVIIIVLLFQNTEHRVCSKPADVALCVNITPSWEGFEISPRHIAMLSTCTAHEHVTGLIGAYTRYAHWYSLCHHGGMVIFPLVTVQTAWRSSTCTIVKPQPDRKLQIITDSAA